MKAEETKKASPLPIEWWQHLSYEQPLESGDKADIIDKADFLRAMNAHAQNQLQTYKDGLRKEIEEEIEFLRWTPMATLRRNHEISGLQKAKSLLDKKDQEKLIVDMMKDDEADGLYDE